mmetsp:Transcript_16227/g.47321  ORF Transcript_16227/g.47321 Transcript_16227/m.47321 type:complete len:247 (-) Transcript_16227:407-1147(-)
MPAKCRASLVRRGAVGARMSQSAAVAGDCGRPPHGTCPPRSAATVIHSRRSSKDLWRYYLAHRLIVKLSLPQLLALALALATALTFLPCLGRRWWRRVGVKGRGPPDIQEDDVVVDDPRFSERLRVIQRPAPAVEEPRLLERNLALHEGVEVPNGARHAVVQISDLEPALLVLLLAPRARVLDELVASLEDERVIVGCAPVHHCDVAGRGVQMGVDTQPQLAYSGLAGHIVHVEGHHLVARDAHAL